MSDDTRDERKFAMEPTRYPANLVTELEKSFETMYKQWIGVKNSVF
jgi:hypothetical protein